MISAMPGCWNDLLSRETVRGFCTQFDSLLQTTELARQVGEQQPKSISSSSVSPEMHNVSSPSIREGNP